MKIVFKLCGLLLCVLTLVAAVVLQPMYVQAVPDGHGLAVEVEVITPEVAYGSQVKVAVKIPENQGFLGVNFDVTWDGDILEFVKVDTAFDFALVEANHQQKFNKVVVTVGDPLTGVMHPDKAENVSDTGKVLELTLKTKADTEASPEIKLDRASYVLTDGEVTDEITLKNGTVKISGTAQQPTGGTDETCPTENGTVVHTPGAAATCAVPQRCTACGAVLAEKLAHDLESIPAQEASCGESGWKAYEKCKKCAYTTFEKISATGEHAFDEWTVITEATEMHTGEQVRKCATCGFTESEEIPMLDSSNSDATKPDGTVSDATDPNATEDGTPGQNTEEQNNAGNSWLPIAAALGLVCVIVVIVILKKKKDDAQN